MIALAEVGRFALLAALAAAAFGIAATAFGLRRGHPAFVAAGGRAVHVFAAFVALASLVLLAALLGRRFDLRFVAEVTSRDLPLLYTVAAFWGGHAGSLLLWTLILAGYGLAAQRALRARGDLAPYVMLVVLGTGAFFSAALAFGSDPFAVLTVPPPDGRGLNPLLRNPWMAAHPPALYLGFVGMTVPYALAVAALATGSFDARWIRLARRWVLWSWLFLTAGLFFGAKWSYVVLGWGGYWAWDPVENAALMPWLTATAFLHSIQVSERRGLLRGWTAALMILSFALAIFGTFLTRSGLLGSVHAFAQSAIGVYLLAFLVLALAAGFGLLLWRAPQMRTEAVIGSVLSREAAFLANNVLLVVAACTILLGTVFPILAEATTGDRINVGPPYFTLVLAPIAVLLLALMAVGPLLPWRSGHADALARAAAAPAAAGVLAAVALAAFGLRSAIAGLLVGLCVFVAGTVVVEFRAGLRRRGTERREVLLFALGALIVRSRRRYGGYVVHFGLLLVLASVTLGSALATQAQGTLPAGATLAAGPYVLRYDGVEVRRGDGRVVTTAAVTALRAGRVLATLRPRHVRDEARDEVTAQVAIHGSWRDDLYVVLVRVSPQGQATLRVLVNPLVRWLWTGVLIMLLGGAAAALPALGREIVPAGVFADSPAPVAGGGGR